MPKSVAVFTLFALVLKIMSHKLYYATLWTKRKKKLKNRLISNNIRYDYNLIRQLTKVFVK